MNDVLEIERIIKNIKPIVYYTPFPPGSVSCPIVGKKHDVIPVQHYRNHLSGIWTITSTVVSVEENGTDFETVYSRYVLDKKKA